MIGEYTPELDACPFCAARPEWDTNIENHCDDSYYYAAIRCTECPATIEGPRMERPFQIWRIENLKERENAEYAFGVRQLMAAADLWNRRVSS